VKTQTSSRTKQRGRGIKHFKSTKKNKIRSNGRRGREGKNINGN
jgi:hypothetical protein